MTTIAKASLIPAGEVAETSTVTETDGVIVEQNGVTRRALIPTLRDALGAAVSSADKQQSFVITDTTGEDTFALGYTPASADAIRVDVRNGSHSYPLAGDLSEFSVAGETLTLATPVYPPAVVLVTAENTSISVSAITDANQIQMQNGQSVQTQVESLWGFATRADLVTYISAPSNASKHSDGDVFRVGHLEWVFETGCAEVSDMAELRPVGHILSTEHFASTSEAYAYASANNVLVAEYDHEQSGDSLPFNTGRFRLGTLSNWNQNLTDAYWAVNAQVTDSNQKRGATPIGHQRPSAISGHVTVTDADSEGSHIGVQGSASTTVDASYPDRCSAMGIHGQGKVVGGTTGEAFGGYFAANFNQSNSSGTVDGLLVGITVAAKNFGGTDVSDVTTELRKVAIQVDGGSDSDSATDLQPSTAVLLTNPANDVSGWHHGFWMRRIRQNIIVGDEPNASGCRAMWIKDQVAGWTTGDWDTNLIVLPSGHGYGVDNNGTISDGFTMDTTRFRSVLNITSQKDGAVPRIYTERYGTVNSGDTVGVLHFDGNNSASAMTDYARVTGKAATNTDTAEEGSILFEVMDAGSLANVALMNSDGLRLYKPLRFGTTDVLTGQMSAVSTSGGSEPTADAIIAALQSVGLMA